jgi:hypothetical protein
VCLFGRAPAGAVSNGSLEKGSSSGALQEPEPFCAAAGEATKLSFSWLLMSGRERTQRSSVGSSISEAGSFSQRVRCVYVKKEEDLLARIGEKIGFCKNT